MSTLQRFSYSSGKMTAQRNSETETTERKQSIINYTYLFYEIVTDLYILNINVRYLFDSCHSSYPKDGGRWEQFPSAAARK